MNDQNAKLTMRLVVPAMCFVVSSDPLRASILSVRVCSRQAAIVALVPLVDFWDLNIFL